MRVVAGLWGRPGLGVETSRSPDGLCVPESGRLGNCFGTRESTKADLQSNVSCPAVVFVQFFDYASCMGRFAYGGLQPHQFTPMLGVHNCCLVRICEARSAQADVRCHCAA